MNATEQRTHRTVTASLDARVAALETLVETLIAQDQQLLAAGRELGGLVRRLEASVQAMARGQRAGDGR